MVGVTIALNVVILTGLLEVLLSKPKPITQAATQKP
jgi:hypothetical protein